MATSPNFELSNQHQIRKLNKNNMIRTTDGTKTKKEPIVTQDQQLSDDSVSYDLRRNLISQIREACTHVNEMTVGNRQIISKLDHYQNNSFNENDHQNESKEITDCKFPDNNEVQHLKKTAIRSDCARAIETAESLSRTLDTVCECYKAQTHLERPPTSASRSNSVKLDPSSVIFCSRLRRKHIYVEDDNRVVLFLSGDIHLHRKSPYIIQTPNVSKIIHMSRSKNLETDKFQQYSLQSSLTHTTTTSTATKETLSAKASTIKMVATALTEKATTAEAITTRTTKAKTEMETFQAYPSTGNITRQLRRNQTKIKDDNRLVSYERSKENQFGESKSNSSTRTTGMMKDSTQIIPSKEAHECRTHRVLQGTVKSPSQVTMDLVETNQSQVIHSRLLTQNVIKTNGETLRKRALPTGKKYHVFISYSSFDILWVRTIVKKLETDHGFICCEYDRDNIPGTPLLKFASDSIRNSHKTLIVITKEAMRSGFVIHEIEMALNHGFDEKRTLLVPLLLEDCEVPSHLKVLNYIDARDPNKRDIFWPKLIKELDMHSHSQGYIKEDAIAFTVALSTHARSTDGSTISFDKVITRMGVSSGIQRPEVFTCPDKGIYKFQVYSLPHSNARVWLELYRNQELVVSLYGHTPFDYAQAGNAVILFLSKDDVVSVKAHNGLDVILYGTSGEIYTTFTGVRLTDSLVTANGIHNDIAFSAILATHRVFYQGSAILYDRLLLNDGNGFNIQTGIFKAPRNGIYIFHFFSLGHMGSIIWQELYHNSDYVCALYGLTPNDWATAGNTVILHLKSDDTVQIRARGINMLYGNQNEIYSTFSGNLIATESPTVQLSTWMAAFSVGLSVPIVATQNSKVVFDRIFINLKAAYDQRTGIFTAPTDGLYEFNVHMLELSCQLAWLELYHNHKYIISLWSNPLVHCCSAGNSAVIKLDYGDVVYVKVRDQRNFRLHGDRDQIFCTFSGYLYSSTLSS